VLGVVTPDVIPETVNRGNIVFPEVGGSYGNTTKL
jgi:hypothetical protein